MTTNLPDDDTLYAALCAKDPTYEGRAYVGVRSTGIFCRLTCPARKPLRKNCVFYPDLRGCLEAGFRPCKRCTPLTPEGDPLVRRMVAALEADPQHRWTEADIHALGLDPRSLRRRFKQVYGMTFLELARLRRLGQGFTRLAAGGPVIEAQLDAGFDSGSGFRAAFARLMGKAPGQIPREAHLRADWIDSPLGPLVAVSCADRLHLLEFADRKALPRELARLESATGHGIALGGAAPTDQIRAELEAYFARRSARFDTPLALHGSDFTQEVWQALRQIPVGETRSYGHLAQALGRPSASRAVARANGANQIAIAIPCHRVLGADGQLTGYGGGLWRKQRLIEIETAHRAGAPRL